MSVLLVAAIEVAEPEDGVACSCGGGIHWDWVFAGRVGERLGWGKGAELGWAFRWVERL